MPKCTINGKPFEVKDGTSIIEAFSQMGVKIAHYCWHPGLSVAGVCRMCMVEIEGQPKLQIACNTKITEGMVINNQSEKVKDAAKWALDFHLINHPLDCPICDRAGECGLQEQYMMFGKYDPEMGQHKVKKHKVVDLGERVVLDTERCILCSRCVRFTGEVTKTNEFHIANRGDHSEIGTFEGKPLRNNYSVNTVDICPVGALTSKDFRFKQRVWFLKEVETVCNGCSTGCNVKASYNKNGVYRLKPVYNEKVNGYWMCDKGRDTYKYTNTEFRLKKAQHVNGSEKTEMAGGAAAKQIAERISHVKSAHGADSIAVVMTAQFTNEENDAMLDAAKNTFGTKNVFYWVNNKTTFDEFDGLLYRGDKNPNTKGLLKSLGSHGYEGAWEGLEQKIKKGEIKLLIVAGPENYTVYPDLEEKVKLFAQAAEVVWFTPAPIKGSEQIKNLWLVPTKTYLEKSGTFTNYQGMEQKINIVLTIVSEALNLIEAAALISGKSIPITNKFIAGRVHNEFIHHRGSL